MPFTASHAAAVLPFLRSPLPASALVIGSMAPDLQYFVPLDLTRSASHSWPGVLTIDLPIGIAALALWLLLLRAPVLDYSPGWLRERMPPRVRARSRLVYAALVFAALELGILTHLILDFPTHKGWLSDHVTWMQGSVGPFTVIRILHFSASVIGAVIIAVWARGWVRRVPRTPREALVGQRERVVVWVTLAGIVVAGCVGIVGIAVTNGRDVMNGSLWFYAFCTAAGTACAVLTVISAIWWLRRRRAAGRDPKR